MTNRQKISFEKLLELHNTNIVDAHMIDIYVDPSQMFQQLNWFQMSPDAPQIEPEEEQEEEALVSEQVAVPLFRVDWKKVTTVFNTSHASIRKGLLSGVKWIGSAPGTNELALCEVNLNHPKLAGFGLTQKKVEKGQKMFYTSKEAMELFKFKTAQSVYRMFDETSEQLRIGINRRFPIALTKIKIAERQRIMDEHYKTETLLFPTEVLNEN